MQSLTAGQGRHVPVKEGSTDFVPVRDRLRYWESYTRSELVGLRCSSYASEGLCARQRNYDLGSLRIADITGNEHVVERTMPIVRRHPKDAVFACLLLEGDAFFYQAGSCTPVHGGDLIIYGTTKPYLYGFTRPMRQLMIDISADELFESGSGPAPSSLLRIDGSLRAGRLLTQPLRDRILGFIENPLRERVPSMDEQIRASLRMLLRPMQHPGSRPGDIAALRLLRAERFIAEHLAASELDAETVARHMAMSLRNLNRVFEKHECSVTQWIWQQRLALAHRLLADPVHSTSPIGDIALGCGFSTQAHFAREFKHRYGLTPTKHRDTALGSQVDASCIL
ncbi:AraC family transcriptional regulator [Aquabacterium sp.]|uniref:AraC family transcriptional regulator n=1 Tax=Aquabacterium sp. TaxID=1872578 RepID=UPI002B8BF876|nr:AraC family transcriptional regulator [Aquabacterium sp.]HSW06043.1 AraC family transcriptional regulator [Aquabacterium sp.]